MNKELTHNSLSAVIVTTVPFFEFQATLQKLVEIQCYGIKLMIATYRTYLLWQAVADYIINLIVMSLKCCFSKIHFCLAGKLLAPPREMIYSNVLPALSALVVIL